jgi:hypothetical protein
MTDLTQSIRKCAPITRIPQVLAAIYISTCAEGFESKCQIVNGIGTDSGRNDREPVFGNP